MFSPLSKELKELLPLILLGLNFPTLRGFIEIGPVLEFLHHAREPVGSAVEAHVAVRIDKGVLKLIKKVFQFVQLRPPFIKLSLIKCRISFPSKRTVCHVPGTWFEIGRSVIEGEPMINRHRISRHRTLNPVTRIAVLIAYK